MALLLNTDFHLGLVMAVETTSQLISIVTLLSAAVIAVPLFKKFALGSVLGYLAAGLAIGPFGLKMFHNPQEILHIAELGVVMFLFIIGLEMKPSHLWSLRRQIFGLGSAQVLTVMFVMILIGIIFFNEPWQVSFICSTGFVLTSTAIVMQVLNEKNELSSLSGQRMVSILLFEDLLIVPLLAIVSFLAPTVPEVPHQDKSIWASIGIALASLTALVVAGKFLLNPLFSLLAKCKAREVMTAAALLVVLGAALLMEASGLSMAMGAFIAGVLLSESSFRHQLEADIEPFRGLLLGLFFLGVGMALDLTVVIPNWKLILAAVFALMLAKGAGIYAIARLAGHDNKQAIERAVLMAQGGEFAFVLFSAAASQGVISATVHANMTAVVVLSMAFTPLFMIAFEKIIKPKLKTNHNQRANDKIHEENPIIVIGMGRFGQMVSNMLLMSEKSVTIIDKDAKMVDGLNNYGIKTYFGDASNPEILHAAGIDKAKILVVAIDNKQQALQIVHFAREHNPNIKIIARAYDRIHGYALHKAGANQIIRETFDSALRAGKTALELTGINEHKAKEVRDLIFRRDHHMVLKLAKYYQSGLGFFQNKSAMKETQKYDIETKKMVQAILNDEVVLWSENDTHDNVKQ